MKNKGQIFILIGFIGILIIYRIFGYIGHYGYDDLRYAEIASNFNKGIIDYNDHFTFRTPIILLTALSYSLFGISDFASSLPSICVSIFVLFIVYKLLKERGNEILILGMTLTVFSHWYIFYSNMLMPDIYIVLSVICSLYVIHQYRYKNKNNKAIVYSFFLSLSLLFGFMSKGTIVLILPLLLYYFTIDIIQKQNIRFWIFSIFGVLVMFSAYFLVSWYITGDLFKRFEAIEGNSYLNLCSYDKQPVVIVVKRIIYGFLEMIIYQGLITGFIFVFPYFFGKKSFLVFKMNDSFSFWMASSVILFLSSNFMSISFTSYSPMCLDPRHYLFLVPVVSVPASIIIKDFIDKKVFKIQIIALTMIVTIISFFLQGNNFWKIYFPLSLLFIAYLFVKNNWLYQNIFMVLFVAILFIKPLSMIIYAQKIKYPEQKEIFKEHILNRSDSCIVVTNDVQKRLGIYYNKFNNNGLCNIQNYNEFRYDSTDIRKKILFLNWYTRTVSQMKNHELPYYAKNISTNNSLLYQNKKLHIEIYEMNDFSIPEQTGKLLFHSINDFEKKYNNWSNNNLSSDIKYEGDYSMEVLEFSSTFEFSIDSLDLININQIYISCSAYCNYLDQSNSKLVITVENKEGAYIYDGIEINKYIKAYSNWWPIKHKVGIRKSDLKENSKIKIYLWNVDKKKAYIDDFQVEILGFNN